MLIKQNECMVGIEPQTQNNLCRKWETEENLTMYYFGLIDERMNQLDKIGVFWDLLGSDWLYIPSFLE